MGSVRLDPQSDEVPDCLCPPEEIKSNWKFLEKASNSPASDSFQFSDLYTKITWETRCQGKKAEKVDLESIESVGWE